MAERGTDWKQTAIYIAAWLASAVLAIVDLLYIREAVLSILTLIQVSLEAARRQRGLVGREIGVGFTIQAIDGALLFIGGIATVGIVLGIEYYFRKGEQKGQLYPRILKVIGIEVLIVIAGILIQVLVSLWPV